MYTTKWTIESFIRHDAAIINACECTHKLSPQDSQSTCYFLVFFHILVGPSKRSTAVQCKKILEAFPRYIAPFADMPSPTRPLFVAFPHPSFQPAKDTDVYGSLESALSSHFHTKLEAPQESCSPRRSLHMEECNNSQPMFLHRQGDFTRLP